VNCWLTFGNEFTVGNDLTNHELMSRIGNKPVEIPDKVKVNIDNAGAVSVEGPRGKLQWNLPRDIRASVQDNRVSVVRAAETRSVKALHGLSRSLVHNMVQGVSEGFTKQLEIEGVGFRAAVQGSTLNLSLGFSHPVPFSIPKDIKITVTENTKIKIEGVDKKLVGQVAADIRRFYPPEPYKGKGVRYAGEQIRRKEGKTVQ
jgi:large subunit ribosomal protein L6